MPFDAYHKMPAKDVFAKIVESGFHTSTPADKHWLGEGVYFFLDPNGHYWAARWPMNNHEVNYENIIKTTLDPNYYIDFTDKELVNRLMLVVNRVRLQLKVEGNSTTDGAIFECFLASGLLNDDSGLAPQMFIADFDKNLERYRIEGSRVFTYDVPDGIKRFPQRQACVIDKSVIGGLEIAEPSKTGG